MTDRERELIRTTLEYLAADDVQADEAVIHRGIYLLFRPRPLLSEMSAALKVCEENHWIIGIRTPFYVAWSITAKGRAQLVELNG